MIRLAVSVGCPSGIGPEVSVAAAARLSGRRVRALLVGDLGALRAAARLVGVAEERLELVTEPEEGWSLSPRTLPVLQTEAPLRASERRPGRPGQAAGAAQLAWVDAACDLVAAGRADAIVTGPVSKDVIARSGAPGSRGFLGHTEHLAARLGAREVTMAFHEPSRPLTTSLVTTHLPLGAVPRAITPAAVARAAFWTADFVARLAAPRAQAPRVVVAALNPHAGERGLLGREEDRAIRPGVERARARIADAGLRVVLEGPLPAETAFRLAADGAYAAVVAMYHDQATIPMKLLGFGDAVNVSLGLPVVRTSVDHGTAYDRAGEGTADPGGMIAAMELAARLARTPPVSARGSRTRATRSRSRT